MSSQVDLNLVSQIQLSHFVPAIPIRDQVELGVAITAWVRKFGSWESREKNNHVEIDTDTKYFDTTTTNTSGNNEAPPMRITK
jgi:hypothetical protein